MTFIKELSFVLSFFLVVIVVFPLWADDGSLVLDATDSAELLSSPNSGPVPGAHDFYKNVKLVKLKLGRKIIPAVAKKFRGHTYFEIDGSIFPDGLLSIEAGVYKKFSEHRWFTKMFYFTYIDKNTHLQMIGDLKSPNEDFVRVWPAGESYTSAKIVKTIQVELAADTITAIYPFDGTPLNISWKKYMKDLPPLEHMLELIKMLEEILSIVEVFHENDFEHLDMAYRNILWSKKKGIRIIDFQRTNLKFDPEHIHGYDKADLRLATMGVIQSSRILRKGLPLFFDRSQFSKSLRQLFLRPQYRDGYNRFLMDVIFPIISLHNLDRSLNTTDIYRNLRENLHRYKALFNGQNCRYQFN